MIKQETGPIGEHGPVGPTDSALAQNSEVVIEQSRPVEFDEISMDVLDQIRCITKLPTKLENNFVVWTDIDEPPAVPFYMHITKILVRDKKIVIKGVMKQTTAFKNKWGTAEIVDYTYACEFDVCPVIKLLPTLVAIKDWEIKYDLSLSGTFKE